MAYRGTGAPKFGTLGASYTMPIPIKGGRNETFEPIQDVYENIEHKLIPAERVLRFVGEYEFSEVPTATLSLLIAVYNYGRTMMWAPHGDLDKIRYEVIVEEFKVIPINGLIDFDGLTMKLRALAVINMIPTSDNIFRLNHRYPYLASIAVITAGAFVPTTVYSIRTIGNTDWVAIGNSTLIAGAFGVGARYIILTIGTTDYTLIGASANTIGLPFIATGIGAGTGTVLKSNFTATGVGSGTGTAIEVES
jgi:hypothetical protein